MERLIELTVLLVSQAVSLDVAFRIAQRRFNKENKRVP